MLAGTASVAEVVFYLRKLLILVPAQCMVGASVDAFFAIKASIRFELGDSELFRLRVERQQSAGGAYGNAIPAKRAESRFEFEVGRSRPFRAIRHGGHFDAVFGTGRDASIAVDACSDEPRFVLSSGGPYEGR